MKGISSKLIQGDRKSRQEVHRSLKTPVYDTASFDFETAEDVASAFAGKSDAYMYSRISNPTVSELENRLKLLTEAEDALCVSSGMAAISNTLFAICEPGDNIISSRQLFSNTFVLFTKTFPALGIEVKFIEPDDAEALEAAIDDRTRVVFLEIMTNPLLKVYDIEKVSRVAKNRNVLLMVDNSMLSPYIFRSALYGVDIEVISTTKFISGGATSVGGAIFTYPTDKWQYLPKIKNEFLQFGNAGFFRKLSREIYRNIGSCMSPHNAWLQLTGLETLVLRVDKICANATEVAHRLQQDNRIKHVVHPSLPNNPYYHLSKKLFANNTGCLVGVELNDKEACYRFMNALKMIRRGTNFCDNKSMIIHPASTMYADFSAAEREAMCISDGYMRLAVGLEDVEDIMEDILTALSES